MSDQKKCTNCGNRCMDMDLEPYCYAPQLLTRYRFGLTLSHNKIEGCQDKDYAWWVPDMRQAAKPA